jgi:hypothetical protein
MTSEATAYNWAAVALLKQIQIHCHTKDTYYRYRSHEPMLRTSQSYDNPEPTAVYGTSTSSTLALGQNKIGILKHRHLHGNMIRQKCLQRIQVATGVRLLLQVDAQLVWTGVRFVDLKKTYHMVPSTFLGFATENS